MLTINSIYIKPSKNDITNDKKKNTFSRWPVTSVNCSYNGLYDSHDWHKLDSSIEYYGEQVNERAILLQSLENYTILSKTRPTLVKKFPGTFGENIVVSGLPISEICIGDIFQIKTTHSNLTIQVTSPRKPCYKLDKAHNSPYGLKGLKRYCLTHGLAGWFCKILTPGIVSIGDTFIKTSHPHPKWSLDYVSTCLYSGGNYKIQSACKAHWYEKKELLEELAAIKELAMCEWMDEVIALLDGGAPDSDEKAVDFAR